ncbi:hypothetical protein N657DRAFT_674368 [Parathielavia appendiculata]|uniref:Protein kinase domain-containing protein n=1 Tax=Parathielavia appendiculata TaxID=2587402 RepID=A0AAN6Z181_9PEZI|nr:hypothetical protein N657DRAFT_674368 [Parathielavia appendiculata]
MMASILSAKTGILAKAMQDRLGHDGPGECITSIRCNGREFHIGMSPFFICNSPAVESRYRKYIAAVRDGWEGFNAQEGEHPEDLMDCFHAWLIIAFEPVFLDVAPDVPPFSDPAKIAAGEAHPLLPEYFFPEEYRCRLEQYVKFFYPHEVEVSFEKPDYALSEMPTRALVELDDSGSKTLCFLKAFALFVPDSSVRLERELEAHPRILKSSLAHDARIVRLCAVVSVEEDCRILGLLLTYIDRRRENDGLLLEDHLLHTPIPLRQRWAKQIQETVEQLHGAGLVWGDAKVENELIDKDDDVWPIGFGGGYTDGWGVAKVVEHLSNEEYEPYPDSDDSDEDVIGVFSAVYFIVTGHRN